MSNSTEQKSEQKSDLSLEAPEKKIARNDPCPCGSGKKYKRCHGTDAPPLLSTPKSQTTDNGQGANSPLGALPEGFDPSQIDPVWLKEFTGAMQKLPKGQLLKLQMLMMKAMAGKDVSKDAGAFEKMLPVEIQSLISKAPHLKNAAKGEGEGNASVAADQPQVNDAEKNKLSKFWRGFFKR